MALTIFWYGNALLNALKGLISLQSTNIKAIALTSSYTPNQDTHDFLDDIIANECTGDGYTSGGVVVNNPSLTYTGGSNLVTLDCDDISFPGVYITARYIALYDNRVAGNSNKPLICYIDLGEDLETLGGDLKLIIDDNGLLKGTVTAPS